MGIWRTIINTSVRMITSVKMDCPMRLSRYFAKVSASFNTRMRQEGTSLSCRSDH